MIFLFSTIGYYHRSYNRFSDLSESDGYKMFLGDTSESKKKEEMTDQQHKENEKPIPRFADFEDLEKIEELGWPLDAPESYQILQAGPTSNHPGRTYLRMKNYFCFWIDEPQKFDHDLFAQQVEKKRKESESFRQRQQLMTDSRIQALLERRKSRSDVVTPK